jgi:hypothetical protein
VHFMHFSKSISAPPPASTASSQHRLQSSQP